jgi:hypothetical protein
MSTQHYFQQVNFLYKMICFDTRVPSLDPVIIMSWSLNLCANRVVSNKSRTVFNIKKHNNVYHGHKRSENMCSFLMSLLDL